MDDIDYSSGIRVNDEFISEHDILAEVQYHPRETYPLKKAASALVIRSLLIQQAKKLNVSAVPIKLGDWRTEVEEEALIRTLIEHQVSVQPVEESECREYYDAHATQFRSPDIFEARHILYGVNAQNPEQIQEARNKAVNSIKVLCKEPERFEAIARSESTCTSGQQGGYLGQFLPGQMAPNFEAALQGLAKGELCQEVVQTIHGFHIIQMIDRESGRQLPFESVREEIAEYLDNRQWRRAVRSYLKELVRQANISGWTSSDTVEW